MADRVYRPHWKCHDSLIHVGNFTGPFTACGKQNQHMKWTHPETSPPTCVECIDYMSRHP